MDNEWMTPRRPNARGRTPCIVQWMVETPEGWLGAYDKAAFDAYASQSHKQLKDAVMHAISELEEIDDETAQAQCAYLRKTLGITK